ncbi:glutathione-disulfide reductase [uncultured Algimonas sp.]|uniref:glutathione-disulfide reductase n=1 Tax=uncultured Algimonas sp. TaxID=1547920 RepID=UPI002613D35F|nr:glutathione-disulfide reductase [uncultured Algimonas sp.]
MSDYDYDLFVIGAGSGGVRAGRLAAQLGKRVGVAEESLPGGTCVVRGCVPKKFLVYGADFGDAIRDAEGYGWSVDAATFEWSVLRDSIQKEVNRLSGIYSTILEKNGADLFRERAEFVDAHTLRLVESGKTVTAETILIAVGGSPWAPDLKGIQHTIVSDDIFHLPEQPKRMLIIGGGYIACEFAGVFAGLGTDVIQAYRGGRLLNGFDAEVRDEVGHLQLRNGIDLRFNISPTEIRRTEGGLIVSFDDGSKIGTDCVLMATGRRPKTDTLGVEAAGVKVDPNGAVQVDAYSRTSQPNIYAVGDVTNRVNLTPVAIREGAAFVETVFKDNPVAFDHDDIASAVFTRPPVGVCGMSEGDARRKYGDAVTVYTTQFRPMKNILAGNEHRCFMKVVTKGEEETVIGVHLVGDDSAEMIQMVGIAIKAKLTKADFDATCAVHPTIAEEIVTLKPREINKTTVVT